MFSANHTLSQQYFDLNNGDVCSGHGFLNSHTIHQCEDPSSFKNIDDDFEKGYGYVSSGFVLKTATLSPSVMIQVTLMILMGMLKMVMLLVDMVI